MDRTCYRGVGPGSMVGGEVGGAGAVEWEVIPSVTDVGEITERHDVFSQKAGFHLLPS